MWFFFSLSWLQSAIHPTYGSWVSHLSVVFVPQKENLCTYQSMCGVHLIYGSNSTFLYAAFSYSLLAVKTSACLSVYINAQWMNMTSHFFLMSPSSVCNKSSEFKLNRSSLWSTSHGAAWREILWPSDSAAKQAAACC